MFIAITRLEVKSFWKAFRLLILSGKIISEAKSAQGSLHVAAYNSGLRNFYTITAWESKDDMEVFIRGGTHLQAMRESRDLARSLSSTHFYADTVPGKAEVKAILLDSEHNKSPNT